MKIGGQYELIHVRRHRCIGTHQASNAVTDSGLSDILNCFFDSKTPPATWYVGLIGEKNFTQLMKIDSGQAHVGWEEFTDYEGERPLWSPDTTRADDISNVSYADFDITTTGAIRGIFLTSGEEKGSASSTQILWSTTLLDNAPLDIQTNDMLRVKYSAQITRGT